MIAYFVYNPEKKEDIFVLPDMGCSVAADKEKFEEFIGVQPEFTRWAGDSCTEMAPEDFGKVVASREATGDVCILDENLWRERMAFYS